MCEGGKHCCCNGLSLQPIGTSGGYSRLPTRKELNCYQSKIGAFGSETLQSALQNIASKRNPFGPNDGGHTRGDYITPEFLETLRAENHHPQTQTDDSFWDNLKNRFSPAQPELPALPAEEAPLPVENNSVFNLLSINSYR